MYSTPMPFLSLCAAFISLPAVVVWAQITPASVSSSPASSAINPATSAPALSPLVVPASTAARRLFVNDGQLKSHPFIVFVTQPITADMNPQLILRGAHLTTETSALENVNLSPTEVIPGHTRLVQIGFQTIPAQGTLLMFDLSRYPLPRYKAAVRFLPSVIWTEKLPGGAAVKIEKIAAEEEVYIGNMPGAVAWTVTVIGFVLALLVGWTRSKAKQVTKFPVRRWLFLITGPDGYLSLWRAQLMSWTFAVGAVVFLFALTRLRVPDVPETLVALMGMSILTGTLSAMRASSGSNPPIMQPPAGVPPQPAPVFVPAAVPMLAPGVVIPAAAPAVPPVAPALVAPPEPIVFNPGKASWSDLISVFNKASGQVELSVPKAQMVFWTLIILLLFVVKSILLGALWAVPWEMVALTGVSQAGYIGDKLISK